MPFLSRFKNKGAQPSSKAKGISDLTNGHASEPHKPRWQAQWSSKTVVPEEVEELIHACTAEMKSRAEALDAPFLLLPFRPATDASGARSFIRNFYKYNAEGSHQYRGTSLQQELRLTEPIVLCSIMKWCWSRLPDGVVGWPVYEGFQIGEKESNLARNAFETFIPLSCESQARKNIIVDFFDLLSAVAAHGKTNGMAGRKLSRLAGWWAFSHSDDGKGFEGGYKSWARGADATSHLFFAYLRGLSAEANPAMSLIERIPRSLQALLASTEYPPETPTLMQTSTSRVVMLVDAVSPTPFALLRRAKHFEYRDRDQVLREYAEFEDPVDALTEECKRVLYAISSTNSSAARSRHRNLNKTDESWSAFQNMGFGEMDEKALQKTPSGINGVARKPPNSGLRSEPRSRNADHGRPTTPSWADFLSSGFAEDDAGNTSTTLLMPPDQVLPPIGSRAQTPSRIPEDDQYVAPGELAAITSVDLDDAFWWVWMISLAGEEPAERKAVFGRCAIIETSIMHGSWLIMEEQVKGASPDPENGAYIAPKKSFFSFTKRGRLGRKKSTGKKSITAAEPPMPTARASSATPSKTSLAPDQQSKIKQAAAALKRQDTKDEDATTRRGRNEDPYSSKTNSTLTMGLQTEAGPAMKWMGAYDKHTLRAQYLGESLAGKGMSREDILLRKTSSVNMNGGSTTTLTTTAPAPPQTTLPVSPSARDLPPTPMTEDSRTGTGIDVENQPPAPLPPSSPEITALPTPMIDTQREAEKIPVPEVVSPSAMEKELAVDSPSSPTRSRVSRKPVSSAHPAYRQRSVDENTPQTPTTPTQNVAAIAAAKAMQSSPTESQDSGKLKKSGTTSGTSGLKKMFGRNKKDTTNRQSMDVKQMNGLAPPEETVSRRLSLMRKKRNQPPAPPAAKQEIPDRGASELDAAPVMPASHGQFDSSTAAISTTESQDQRHAEEEFSRFDQGPVDMPAVTPQDSAPEIVAPQAQRPFNPRMEAQAAPDSTYDTYETPMEQPEPDMTDAQSETTMEEQPAPEKDRWATIRENAARRAARASEEQSTQSRPSQSARTDDGETSGEETIESRVARIKARVAELTGGMDGQKGRV